MLSAMRSLRMVLGCSRSPLQYQPRSKREFMLAAAGRSDKIFFEDESPLATAESFESEQRTFQKEYKRVLSRYERGDTKIDFQHREKILHSSCENDLSRLLLNADRRARADEINETPLEKKNGPLGHSYVKEYLRQHAMFVEMPGKLLLDGLNLDDMTMEDLKACLRDDKAFRFIMNKCAIKRKDKQKRLAKTNLKTLAEEAESVEHKGMESIVPYFNPRSSYRKHLKWKLMSFSPVEMPLIFDMSFSSYMDRSSAIDLAVQIEHALSYNEVQQHPLPILFANCKPGGATFERLSKLRGFPDDGFMNVTQNHLLELDGIDPQQLIYLTPNADQEMIQFEEDRAYIIGGLVDKGRHQEEHTTRLLSRRIGITCQKLPLSKYLLWGNRTGRQSLNIDAMFKVLHTLRTTQNWPEALQHIPKRFHRGLTEVGKLEAGNDDILQHYKDIHVAPAVPGLPSFRSDKYLGWSSRQ